MKEKKIEVWICKSRSGRTCIFADKPKRIESAGLWAGTVLGSLEIFFTMLQVDSSSIKWKDNPKKITITIGY